MIKPIGTREFIPQEENYLRAVFSITPILKGWAQGKEPIMKIWEKQRSMDPKPKKKGVLKME